MKKLALILLIGSSAMAHSQLVDKNFDPGAGSLWNDSKGNPFVDRTARQEGDIVTILISETSVASFAANTTLNKQDNNSFDLSLFNSFISRLLTPSNTSDSSSNAGGGTSTQNSKLTARLSAVVTKVMPNGNLVIEGNRSLVVNKEIQTFKLTGVIRRDDVTAANTVMSENIAEAEIQMAGKGAIHERQRRGLLTRVLDWLF